MGDSLTRSDDGDWATNTDRADGVAGMRRPECGRRQKPFIVAAMTDRKGVFPYSNFDPPGPVQG